MARTLTGIVTSNKADKTIVITVATRKTHPLYKKQYTNSTKFMAHDEKNEANIGDKVIVSETRPLSARKRFRLLRIVERGGVTFGATTGVEVIIEEPVTQAVPSAAKKSSSSAKTMDKE
jgi:small subunit ribosomal protein S17